MTTYAIVNAGGKQYRVEKGDTIRVESMSENLGDTVEFKDVRMVSRNGEVVLGSPSVKGAKVTTEVMGHGKNDKIVVFKYKSKTRYRVKNGHRQPYTDLKVTGVSYRRSRKKTDGS